MAIAKLFKTVRLYDPAILPELQSLEEARNLAERYRKFASSRRLEDLPFGITPGRAPVYYHLRPIPRRAIAWILGSENTDDKLLRAFSVAVDHVENFRDVDGTFHERYVPERPERKHGEVDAIAGDALDAFQFDDIREIGKVALDRATVPFDCGGGCAPPPSSESAWHTLITDSLFRLAAALTSSSSSGPSEEQPKSSPTSETPIENSSALPGGATAPAPFSPTRDTGSTG